MLYEIVSFADETIGFPDDVLYKILLLPSRTVAWNFENI